MIDLVHLPLAEHGGGVVGLLEDGTQEAVAVRQNRGFAVGLDAVAKRVSAAEEGGSVGRKSVKVVVDKLWRVHMPGRRAHGVGVGVVVAATVACQLLDVRRAPVRTVRLELLGANVVC